MTMYNLQELCVELAAPADANSRLCMTVGSMLSHVMSRESLGGHDVGWHVEQVRTAFFEGRTEMYFDEYGRDAGAIFWKRLDDAGEEAMLAGGEAIELDHAPNGEAWIAHCHVRHVGLAALIERAVRDGPLSPVSDIAYARMRRGWRVAKRTRVPVRDREASAGSLPVSRFLARETAAQLRAEALQMLGKARRLGGWLLLACANQAQASRRPAELLDALVTPLRLDQYVEVSASDGSVGAFITYGLLTEDGLARFEQHGAIALCPACFSEGDVLTVTCAGAIADVALQSALAARLCALHRKLRRVVVGTGVAALEAL